jgi:hypothetical protein
MNSKVWFSGVATYYTLNLERFAGTSFNKIIVQNGFFVTIATYVTVLWETFFPALIWNKKARIPLLALGVMMHMGIYFMMMIHDFEILFIATYGFFFTDKELRWAKNKVLVKFQKVTGSSLFSSTSTTPSSPES